MSPTGIRQAHTVARRLTAVPIDRIIASPLARARETARIIGERLNLPVEHDPDLVEQRNPTELVGLSFEDPRAVAVRQQRRANLHDPSWRYSNKENFHDVKRRAVAFRARLETVETEHLLVVTHGYYLKLLLYVLMLGETVDHGAFDVFHQFVELTNTGISVCQRESSHSWKLLTLNDRLHVPQ